MTPGGRKRSGKGRGAPVAGVDVGGTNIEVGVVDVDHRVLARAKAATPAAGCGSVLGVWMGTGIGGSLILDGAPFHGAGGAAGEIGQDLADQIGAAATPWLLTPHPELRFVAAALGDDSGMVGAAALARAELASSPRPTATPQARRARVSERGGTDE